jgi:hypothetical protein
MNLILQARRQYKIRLPLHSAWAFADQQSFTQAAYRRKGGRELCGGDVLTLWGAGAKSHGKNRDAQNARA